MLNHFLHGLEVLVMPGRAWKRIDAEPYAPVKLGVYTVLLSSVTFFARTLGGVLLDIAFPWFVLEGMLFTLICIGVVLSLGLMFIPCARWARRPVNDGHAMKLALFSATPLWLWGFFQLVPSGLVRTFFLLVSLGHCCWLLFTGLPALLGTEPLHTLVLSLVAAAIWIIGLAVLTQVFLGLAFAL
jgi:hypothetical protein